MRRSRSASRSSHVRLAGLIAIALAGLVSASCGGGDEESVPPTGPEAARTRRVPPALFPPTNHNYVLDVALPLTTAQLQMLEQDFGLHPVSSSGDGAIVLLDGPTGVNLQAVEEALGSAVQETSVNDPVYLAEGATLIGSFAVGNWSTEVANGTGLESVSVAASQLGADGSGVTVAVLDTGVDVDHPQLIDNVVAMAPSTGFSSAEYADGADDDADGAVDEAYGHGTHVAGIVCQIAPGVTVLPIRVLNADGVGSVFDVARGIQAADDAGAQIFNLSLSVSSVNHLLERRIRGVHVEGKIVVAAAGNDGNGLATYPGTSEHALGVAAVDATDHLAWFSGSGPSILLAAPGVNVLSTYPSEGAESQAARASGTSMATPVVCAAIALLEQHLSLAGTAAVNVLLGSTVPVTPEGAVAYGRVAPAVSPETPQ